MPIDDASLRARALGRRGALERSEQGGGEDVEGQRGGDRVARRPEDRRGVDRAEHDGMAGADGHAVDGQRAEAIDDRGRVVVAAGARAGDDDHEVRAGRGAANRRGDALGIVGLDRQAPGLAAGLLGLGGEHQRVRVEDLARPDVRAHRADLVAGRQHGHDRTAVDEHVRRARGGRGGDVDGAQAMALGQQQLGRADVLADRAHVLVGRHGPAHLRRAALVVDLLAHDDGVVALGQRVAGVDDDVGVVRQEDRRALAGADGVGGAHGDAVHRRRVERRRGARGPHRRGGDAADRLGERQADRLDAPRAARGGERGAPGGERLGGGDVVDVGGGGHVLSCATRAASGRASRRRRPRRAGPWPRRGRSRSRRPR
jgi:hypothetical protein